MSDIILKVEERDETARQVRYEGYVPGVMYGTGVEDGMPVKFNELELGKVLKSQGMNPRMEVMLSGEKKNVLIKEVQKEPVKGNILHVDLQAIAVDEVIRTTIPVIFEGRDEVEARHLLLEAYLFEIEVSGPANIIPGSITVDVVGKEPGDTVVMSDIELDSRISPVTPLDEVLAVVTMPREEEEEEAEEDIVEEEAVDTGAEETQEEE